jgi:hypothetical protein
MTILGFLVAVSGIIYQYFNLQTIMDYKEKPAGTTFPIFLFIGMMTVTSTTVGFGRPYLPFVISFISLIGSIVIYFKAPGLMDWFEKTTLLITLLSTVIEYVYYAYWCKEEAE